LVFVAKGREERINWGVLGQLVSFSLPALILVVVCMRVLLQDSRSILHRKNPRTRKEKKEKGKRKKKLT
jgi:hypothetical protein